MAFDVFVSYPHQDKATADAAWAKLEFEGIRCWIAPRDVPPGAEWAGAIVDAIDSCSVMVLIFSEHANQSKQVHREVQRAFDAEKPVVPLRIEEVTPEKSLAYYMASVHWLDALSPPLEKHLEKLAASVTALVRTSTFKERIPHEAAAPRSAVQDPTESKSSTSNRQDQGHPSDKQSKTRFGYTNATLGRVTTRAVGWLDPRGYLATALMLGIPCGIIFGLFVFGWGKVSAEQEVSAEHALFMGLLFGLFFGAVMAIWLRGMAARISRPWSPEIAGLVQMTLAEIGYLPRSTVGRTMTFKPSYQVGFLAGGIAVTGFEDHVDIFGPSLHVRRLISKLGNA